LRWLKELEAEVLLLHAQSTDLLYRRELDDFCKLGRELGVIPGFSTHAPGHTIPFISGMDLDFSVIFAPLNPSGVHVHPDLASSLKAIKETDKTVIGMKILRAGEISPARAFEFAFSHVKGLAVGMVSKEEIDENIKIFEQCPEG